MPAVFVSPSLRERQLREALQEALQEQDAQALRQLSDRLVHRHSPVQLQRWMQALASEPQQLFWRQALAQPSKPVPQPSRWAWAETIRVLAAQAASLRSAAVRLRPIQPIPPKSFVAAQAASHYSRSAPRILVGTLTPEI